MRQDETRLGLRLAQGLIEFARQNLPESRAPEPEQLRRVVSAAHHALGGWLASAEEADERHISPPGGN